MKKIIYWTLDIKTNIRTIPFCFYGYFSSKELALLQVEKIRAVYKEWLNDSECRVSLMKFSDKSFCLSVFSGDNKEVLTGRLYRQTITVDMICEHFERAY